MEVTGVGISHGSTDLISEREKLDFESVPEFVREPRASARDSYSANIATSSDELETKPTSKQSAVLPKTAELEALWPGISHEFLHASPKKGPSFYLCIGFMAGAVCSMIALSGYSVVSHMLTSTSSGGKGIVVSQGQNGGAPINNADGRGTTALTSTTGDSEIILPVSQTYEVGPGDTLAAIALKNYKRATPRLLDEICRANNMRNANVLSLGQKISLPEYRPQRQVATGANTVPQ